LAINEICSSKENQTDGKLVKLFFNSPKLAAAAEKSAAGLPPGSASTVASHIFATEWRKSIFVADQVHTRMVQRANATSSRTFNSRGNGVD